MVLRSVITPAGMSARVRVHFPPQWRRKTQPALGPAEVHRAVRAPEAAPLADLEAVAVTRSAVALARLAERRGPPTRIGGSPLTPVQVQKILFVVGRELPNAVGSSYYRFRPYNYGPFSSEVYEDADALADAGLVVVDRPSKERPWATYAATPAGIAAARKLSEEVPEESTWYVESVVKWATRLTFQQLVSAIYRKYPDQRVNSIFIE